MPAPDYRQHVSIAVMLPNGEWERYTAHHFQHDYGVLEILNAIHGREGAGRFVIASYAPGEWRRAVIEKEPQL